MLKGARSVCGCIWNCGAVACIASAHCDCKQARMAGHVPSTHRVCLFVCFLFSPGRRVLESRDGRPAFSSSAAATAVVSSRWGKARDSAGLMAQQRR